MSQKQKKKKKIQFRKRKLSTELTPESLHGRPHWNLKFGLTYQHADDSCIWKYRSSCVPWYVSYTHFLDIPISSTPRDRPKRNTSRLFRKNTGLWESSTLDLVLIPIPIPSLTLSSSLNSLFQIFLIYRIQS